MAAIRLYNTATRTKVDFTPLDPENVRLYVCGPTVYDRAHLGNARPVVVFDVLNRLLRYVYGADHVTYVRNFTDVDDKINARAREMQAAGDGREMNAIIRALTDETISWYHADMDALGALRPTQEPRATEYIGQMVAMIAGLIETGHAYAAEGHVLFDVRAYPNYGRLSGRSVDDMIAGARVEVAPYKRDPMDFVLWKPSTSEEPGWDSPWGRGRPGWHIECSAMAKELLGPAFDIHGGGIDLQFPHHENEIAQSCCADPGAGFARVWMHNEMVQVEGRKMSKSLGNFFTVRDLLDQGIPGEVIRFVLLSTHYRKPMDWTEERVRAAKWKLAQLHDIVLRAIPYVDPRPEGVYSEIVDALAQDLNTHEAIRHLEGISLFAEDSTHPNRLEAAQELADSLAFLGLFNSELAGTGGPLVDPEKWKRLAQHLAALREQAKARKDFSEVDRFKETMRSAGVEVRMSKADVELVPGPDFDPANLDKLK